MDLKGLLTFFTSNVTIQLTNVKLANFANAKLLFVMLRFNFIMIQSHKI